MNKSFKQAATYRGELFFKILTVPTFVFIYYYIWKALFHVGGDIVKGVSFEQMIVYITVGQLLSTFIAMEIVFELEEHIRDGQIIMLLLKPYDIQLYFLFVVLGQTFYFLIFQLPIVLILAVILLGAVPTVSIVTIIGVIIAAIGAFIITYSINFIIGMLSFWLWEIEPLDRLNMVCILSLSGSIIPLWFYPKILADIAGYLPFKYIYQIPVSIFIGQIPAADVPGELLMSTLWCFGLIVVGRILCYCGLKRINVQGG
jgi:ABC-2 type transport system permease protein